MSFAEMTLAQVSQNRLNHRVANVIPSKWGVTKRESARLVLDTKQSSGFSNVLTTDIPVGAPVIVALSMTSESGLCAGLGNPSYPHTLVRSRNGTVIFGIVAGSGSGDKKTKLGFVFRVRKSRYLSTTFSKKKVPFSNMVHDSTSVIKKN